MFDAVLEGKTNEISPSQVLLNNIRWADRLYAAPELGDGETALSQISVNESKRRSHINMAAGRIVWVTVPKTDDLQPLPGGVWRGVTYDELQQSLLADVAAFKEAEAAHKSAARQQARRRRKTYATETVPYRRVPMIDSTPEQLARGLELMVEQGLLRQEEANGVVTYFVLPSFFTSFKIEVGREEITEP